MLLICIKQIPSVVWYNLHVLIKQFVIYQEDNNNGMLTCTDVMYAEQPGPSGSEILLGNNKVSFFYWCFSCYCFCRFFCSILTVPAAVPVAVPGPVAAVGPAPPVSVPAFVQSPLLTQALLPQALLPAWLRPSPFSSRRA